VAGTANAKEKKFKRIAWYVLLVLAACLVPWAVVLGVVSCRQSLFPPSVPNFDAWSLLGWVVVLIFLALLFLGYEVLFRIVALQIAKDRPNPDFDEFKPEKLIKGFPEKGDRQAAVNLFDAFKRALARLTAKDGESTESLHLDKTTPDAVIEEIVRDRSLAVLDRETLFKRLTYAVDHIQGRIDGEFSAIASRVAWVLASQAFLLSAFVTLVNAERLAPITQFWFAVGVAFIAAVISFVLLLASMFGHALISEMKVARDQLEELLHYHFGIRRGGVPIDAAVHILGHSATRYVPCVLYIAWITLTVAALSNLFVGEAGPRTVVQTVLQGPVRLSQGWVKYPIASPAFRPAAVVYQDQDQDDSCPTSDKAAQWINSVVATWKSRHEPGPNDVLVLVGGADRTRLGSNLQKQIDSNMALALTRAETVRKLLEEATRTEPPLHRISVERVLITVTGPRVGERVPAVIKDCSNQELNEERVVEVWLPGLLPKPTR
jgi:hypothetical protein